MRTTIQEKITIMRAFDDGHGARIEAQFITEEGDQDWFYDENPSWNWLEYNYQIVDPYKALKQAVWDGKRIRRNDGPWTLNGQWSWRYPADSYEIEVDVDEYADLKVAYADGKKIEHWQAGKWRVKLHPMWGDEVRNYRIKPKQRVPFDQEDMRQVQQIRVAGEGAHYLPQWCSEEGVYFGHSMAMYPKLMTHYEWRGLTGDWQPMSKEATT